MRGSCIYSQLMVQMYLAGVDNKTLAQRTGITYSSLRRKLRGQTRIQLEEARLIRGALGCEMPLDQLFERAEEQHG